MLPIQNLLRRKVRTLFALLGIAVGISSVVSIVSVARGLRDQFYRIADQFGYDVVGSYEVVGIFRNPVRDVDLLAGQALMNTAFLSSELSATPSMLVAHLRTKADLDRQDVMDLRQLDQAIGTIGSTMAVTKGLKRFEAKAFRNYLDSFKQTEVVDKFAWAMSFLAALVGGIGIANTML